MASCATDPQAETDNPVAGPATAAEEAGTDDGAAEDVPESSATPPVIADGLRLPNNMLNLPGENQFRATNPTPPPVTGLPWAASQDEPAGIIARPPVEPPRED